MEKIKKPTQICEIYPTLNSGGHFFGHPIMLIRLFGVNFSDKNDLYKYTWQFGQQRKDLEINRMLMSSEEIISKINSFKKGDIFKWCITGGEPLRQQEQLIDLIEKFIESHGKPPKIEIRTRGHIAPVKELDKYVTKYIVSVPLSNSMDGVARETFSHRIKEDILKEFIGNKKALFLFEMKHDNDLKEIRELQQMFNISDNRIWVSPLETKLGAMKVNEVCAWKACLNFGYKYFNRLSVQIFGPNKRNV